MQTTSTQTGFGVFVGAVVGRLVGVGALLGVGALVGAVVGSLGELGPLDGADGATLVRGGGVGLGVGPTGRCDTEPVGPVGPVDDG